MCHCPCVWQVGCFHMSMSMFARPMHACLSKPVVLSGPMFLSRLQAMSFWHQFLGLSTSKEPPHTTQNFRFPLQCQCHWLLPQGHGHRSHIHMSMSMIARLLSCWPWPNQCMLACQSLFQCLVWTHVPLQSPVSSLQTPGHVPLPPVPRNHHTLHKTSDSLCSVSVTVSAQAGQPEEQASSARSLASCFLLLQVLPTYGSLSVSMSMYLSRLTKSGPPSPHLLTPSRSSSPSLSYCSSHCSCVWQVGCFHRSHIHISMSMFARLLSCWPWPNQCMLACQSLFQCVVWTHVPLQSPVSRLQAMSLCHQFLAFSTSKEPPHAV